MRMALLIGWLGVCSVALADEKYADGMTILETSKTGEMKLVAGSKAEMDVAREPASTFKVVIAWAALDRGLVQDVEAALEGAEGLGLRESLQKSINPPFALLAEKLGGDVLGEYAERSGLIEGKIPKGWMRGGGKEAVHGGELKTTIRREHQMAVGWMRGEAPWDGEAGKKLQEALVWDGEKILLRAKTGSYGGCLWMTGYGPEKAVTVFLEGPVSRRPKVLKAFFGRWELESVGR
ncbi:MAG: penicillin-binding transpeptidase domain-containing protein [Verrucomicrobia bacterium]|nr:penicillin-binding transpeptidase domain-containing protein [Verrucomicrobiota bacterium]